MDPKLIEHFQGGGERIALAIRGLTRDDLMAVPPADANVGRWSIQQVVIHCFDSDLICVDRLKRMIAEDNPTLIGYDENKFAANLFYDEQDAGQAVAMIDANRKLFTRVLRKLSDGAWSRTGTHNERGQLTVGGYLKSTVEHLEHHIKFIHDKRAWMGKEMW